jgi:hypothetical protein
MNFSRLIDIKFRTQNKVWELKTPRNGIKPEITISGNLSGQMFCQNLEIHIKNLYCNEIDNTTEIEITAGYKGNMSLVLRGQVANVYTSTPAPDKETVINCVTANYENWLTKTIDLQLEKGWSLIDAITQISNTLDFEPPNIESSLMGYIANCPLYRNGLCSQALDDIKKIFADINIIPVGKKLYIMPKNNKIENVIRHRLTVLTQPPQFTGGAVNIVIPFNAQIKCGDIVQYPTNLRTVDSSQVKPLIFDEAMVNTIDFRFSTTGNDNEMTISGTTLTKLGV